MTPRCDYACPHGAWCMLAQNHELGLAADPRQHRIDACGCAEPPAHQGVGTHGRKVVSHLRPPGIDELAAIPLSDLFHEGPSGMGAIPGYLEEMNQRPWFAEPAMGTPIREVLNHDALAAKHVYSAEQRPLRTNHVAIVDEPPDPECRWTTVADDRVREHRELFEPVIAPPPPVEIPAERLPRIELVYCPQCGVLECQEHGFSLGGVSVTVDRSSGEAVTVSQVGMLVVEHKATKRAEVTQAQLDEAEANPLRLLQFMTVAEKMAAGDPCPLCERDPEQLTHRHTEEG